MTPTPEEKARMDRLLEVFHDFIADNPDIDIAYSEKVGYVRLIIAEDADSLFFTISNFTQLLRMIFFDVICHHVDLASAADPDLTAQTMDYSSAYEYLRRKLHDLGEDYALARNKLDLFIGEWSRSEYLP